MGSVPLAEWCVEKATGGRNLGNTTFALALNLMAFGWLLSLLSILDRST